MHAVRGTIGFDPNPVNTAAKQASRDRHFGVERVEEDEAAVWIVSWDQADGPCTQIVGSASAAVELLNRLNDDGINVVEIERAN